MSSSPPTEAAPVRRPWSALGGAVRWVPELGAGRAGWAGWTLRTRLVLAVLALLAVVCLAIGTVTTVALRYFLIRQLDGQLTGAVRIAAAGPPGRDWPDRPLSWPRSSPHPPAGAPSGTLAARVVDGQVQEVVRLNPGAQQPAGVGPAQGRCEPDQDPSDPAPDPADETLPPGSVPQLADVPADGRPHTRTVGALGDYRLVATAETPGAAPAARCAAPPGDVVWVIGFPLSEVQQTVWYMVAAEAGVAGAGLVVAGTAGALIVRRALRPLRRVAATAGRVAELPLDRGEVALSVRVPSADTDPRTEVGQVGAALNRMLGHVGAALTARQASEMRVRQFVADASHELRTPLAAIRGYAELTRRGRTEVPADIAHALRRVESETTRMTRLVDDLLLLARLDSGRPLAVEPVDLSALLVDVVSDAHVAGPQHTWRLNLPDEAVLVAGDDQRLHQVVGNLLANARTHTPPGTPVTVTLTAAGDTAELAVTDHGPGIPEALQPEIFERFARGDSSRSRAAGSTGLGLAIVAAVVEAHRGTVTLTSRPGRTAFVIALPRLTGEG